MTAKVIVKAAVSTAPTRVETPTLVQRAAAWTGYGLQRPDVIAALPPVALTVEQAAQWDWIMEDPVWQPPDGRPHDGP